MLLFSFALWCCCWPPFDRHQQQNGTCQEIAARYSHFRTQLRSLKRAAPRCDWLAPKSARQWQNPQSPRPSSLWCRGNWLAKAAGSAQWWESWFCSAGAKNWVSVETLKAIASNAKKPSGQPETVAADPNCHSANGTARTRQPRAKFVPTITHLVDQRSTYTPASEPNRMAGMVKATMTAETQPPTDSPSV